MSDGARNRIYKLGPFCLLAGHDVGIGGGYLGDETRIVGRVWGFAIGPAALFWTKNVSRGARRIRRDGEQRMTDEDFE